jgi:hypothetical protein
MYVTAMYTITLLILSLLGLVLYVYVKRWTSRLRHIPTIPGYPLIGSVPFINVNMVHMSLDKWRKKLGPVMVFDGGSPELDGVVVSNCEGIRKVC